MVGKWVNVCHKSLHPFLFQACEYVRQNAFNVLFLTLKIGSVLLLIRKQITAGSQDSRTLSLGTTPEKILW